MLFGYRYLYHLSNGIRSPLPCGNLPYVDVEHSRKTVSVHTDITLAALNSLNKFPLFQNL